LSQNHGWDCGNKQELDDSGLGQLEVRLCFPPNVWAWSRDIRC
jgi:hypothetical protein